MNYKIILYAMVLLLTPSVGLSAPQDVCLGGIGQQCGGSINWGRFALCFPDANYSQDGWCRVNRGSWRHDQCCYKYRNGHWCGGDDSQSSQCRWEWDLALHRTFWGYNWWSQHLDYNESDHDGIVNFHEYCAGRNAAVHLYDSPGYCCSRQRVRAGFWDRIGRPHLYRCL